MILLLNEHEKIFRRFNIISILGKGSFGTVYNVYDKITKENFALKEILINIKNPNTFINEILPYNISHPNVLYYFPLMISKRPLKFNWSNNLKPNINIHDQLTSEQNDCFVQTKYEHFSSPDIQYIENIKLLDNYNVKVIKPNNIKTVKNKKTDVCNLKKTRNWGITKQSNDIYKVRRNKSINEEHFLYLKTRVCSFSLRDFLDVRNRLIFNKGEDANETVIKYEGILNTKVEIPLDLCNKSINNNKICRTFSIGIFRYILLGLLFLHSLGISHNDLKPSNIFMDVTDGYIPKIGDFGSKTMCKNHEGYNEAFESSDYFYYNSRKNIECEHQNSNKIFDCKSLVPILIELLYPFKTHAEMVGVIKKLKCTRKAPFFLCKEYPEESSLIEKILNDNYIDIKTILSLTHKILDVI